MAPPVARPLRLPLIAALLGAALLACATNPVTGQRELSLLSTQGEIALGRQGAAQVEAQMGLVEDPALAAYVRGLGERIAVHSPRRDVPYSFQVVDMATPNAFALPGGPIYVSRGLLALTGSEDELANVIGHEVGHVAARHAAQRQTQGVGVGVLSGLGAVLAGAVGGSEAAAVASDFGALAGAGWLAAYGRDQERQSDEVGQQLALAAGYRPEGMPEFLARLERWSLLQSRGQALAPSFLDTHPVTAERVADTRRRAGALDGSASRRSEAERAAYLARLDGLVLGPDVTQGVFHGQRFLHPLLRIAFDAPPGWATQNRRDAVLAASPQRDAQIVLEGQESGRDPMGAAYRFQQQTGLALEDGTPLSLAGLSAYHATAEAGTASAPVALDFTWVSVSGQIYRFTGATLPASRDRHAASFRATAASLRPLRRSELEGLGQLRLRVVTARSSESLSALSRRTGNAWSLEETAMMNGLPDVRVRLRAGQRLKIARNEEL